MKYQNLLYLCSRYHKRITPTKMTTITITKTSMSTGNTIFMREFTSEKKAISVFKEIANELDYDNKTEVQNSISKIISVGGIGHDFRLELEIVNS